MRNPSPGFPLTSEGQALWIKEFILLSRRLGIKGIFYWSPELYLPAMSRRKDPGPPEMPLGFGWEPMALFDVHGKAKPSINSLET